MRFPTTLQSNEYIYGIKDSQEIIFKKFSHEGTKTQIKKDIECMVLKNLKVKAKGSKPQFKT
jgi:hypothetical protein